MALSYEDMILRDLSAAQGRLRVADSAAHLRAYKEPGSECWEDLTAQLLKEAAIARAGLSRVLDLVAEQYERLDLAYLEGGDRVKGG